MGLILFLLSWFFAGFVGMVVAYAGDMRGREYCEPRSKIDAQDVLLSLGFGYFSLIVAVYLTYEKSFGNFFDRLVYKIANISSKKK